MWKNNGMNLFPTTVMFTLMFAVAFLHVPAFARNCCSTGIASCHKTGFFQCKDGELSKCKCNLYRKRAPKLPRSLPGSVKKAPAVAVEPSGINRQKFIKEWCALVEGKANVPLSDGQKIDCQTDTYAISIGFAKDFETTLGKALHQSTMTKSKAGVVLLLTSTLENHYVQKVKRLVQHHGLSIRVWKAFEN